MVRTRGDEQRLHTRQRPVHLGHLHLILEVRDGAQARDHRRGVDATRHVHQQRRDRDDAHAGNMRATLGDHLAALFQVEERFGLLGIANGRDDHLVKDVRGASHHLQVAVVKRIKGSGDEADGHDSPSSGSNIVTSVVPYRLVFVTCQPCGASMWRSFSTTTRWATTPFNSDARSSGPYGGSQSTRSKSAGGDQTGSVARMKTASPCSWRGSKLVLAAARQTASESKK